MHIIDLDPHDQDKIEQAAHLLVVGFADSSPGTWPDMVAGREEVQDALQPGHLCLLAVDNAGRVVGWVGGIPEYDGTAWELHPLVVHPDQQGRGTGRKLVAALEARVRARGATTIYLGTDDETNLTSLSNKDLYPDVWTHVREIQNHGGHPYSFYQQLGYAIVGVIPDANGPGRPDILMAKRLVDVDYEQLKGKKPDVP